MAASICGTDFRTYLHESSKIVSGTTIGHEMCGEIVEIGKDVQGWNKGALITVTPALGCGNCSICKKGRTNMCDDLKTIGFQFDGRFAEYIEIPAEYIERGYLNRVPQGIEALEAALAEPVACAINAQEYLNIERGDFVAIFGSGFIGCSHAELAFAREAEKVIMIEPNEARREAAKRLVPNIIMTGDVDGLEAEIKEITQGHGVDVAIVACSVGSAQETAEKIIAKCGRISLFGGLPGEGKGYLDSNLIHYKEVGVYGVHASSGRQNRKALELISEGKLNLKKYITKQYPLQNVLKAMEDIRTKGIMKAVIVPGVTD